MTDDGGSQLPLSAERVVSGSTSFDWLTSTGDALHWVADVFSSGHTVLQSWYADSCRLIDYRLPGSAVGSSLHAYGGMPYAVGPVSFRWAVNAADGQVWGGLSQRVTDSAHAYGDLFAAGGELLCIREDDFGDELVAVDPAGGGVRVLRRTSGFLASPRTCNGRLVWVQWNSDVMPWDSCEVWVADYELGGQLGEPLLIAGGTDESAIQPQWGDDGALYFMSDRTGWWNLYRWRDGLVEALAPMTAECATAPWESSYSNYVLLGRGRIGMTVQRGPNQQLVVLEADGQIAPVELPYTAFKPYLTALGDRIALIGSTPTLSQEIAVVATDGSNQVEVVQAGSGHGEEQLAFSVPEVVRVAHAEVQVSVLFYPPTHADMPAPLIVRPHAGPTYHSELRLDWEVQFFTSRGFAVADVDYRGSTGYGRAFRKALDGNWGRFDVEDCRAVALHLLATGRALPGAVFISGASAGGYTALRAVCEDGPFSLAVARSAIVDPKRWTMTAPRFQQPHAAILSHESAAVEASRVRRPVLLIHGDVDAVAPIDDVTELAAALQARQMLIGMLKITGAGHSLLSPAALHAALEAELDAYRAVLIEPGHLRDR